MRSRTEPPHPPAAHRTDCCLPARSYLRQPASRCGLTGLDQSSACTQSAGTNPAAAPSRCHTSNSALLPNPPSHAHPGHGQSAWRDPAGVGARAAQTQSLTASTRCGAGELFTDGDFFLCAFVVPTWAPFFSLLHAGWGEAGSLPSPARWGAGSSMVPH